MLYSYNIYNHHQLKKKVIKNHFHTDKKKEIRLYNIIVKYINQKEVSK